MDGLSSAASAIAVVSLAFQLADTAKQLCGFWSSIRDAPEDIGTITADIELLTSVLAEMASEAQHTGPDKTLVAVLQNCTGKLKSLTALTNSLEPGFSSRSFTIRKWTAIKFVLKSEKLTRFKEVLESLKSTLVLAQQNRHSRVSRMQLEKMATIAQGIYGLSLQQSVASVTTFSKGPADTQNHISALRAETTRVDKNIDDPFLRLGFTVGSDKAVHQIVNQIGIDGSKDDMQDIREPSSPSDNFKSDEGRHFSDVRLLTKRIMRQWDTTTNYLFGTIHTHSTTKQLQSNIWDDQEPDDEDCHFEHQSCIVIRPAAWLVNLGINSGLRIGLFNSSVQGWKTSLNTLNAVPDDSLIFDMSRDGNLSAIKGLFSRGLASVRDTNSFGETPLYVAAASHHPELCRFLIAAGADKSPRSERWFIWSKNDSPVLAASFASTDEVKHFQLSKAMDTIRLFTDEMDFVEADGDGWLVLSNLNHLCIIYEPDPTQSSMKSDLFAWVVHLFSSEIKACFINANYARVLRHIFSPERENVAQLLLKLGPVGAIDAVDIEGDFTTLQYELSWSDCSFDTIKMILANGADIHHLAFDLSMSPVEESPLSIALYSSRQFQRFADALKTRHIDLDEFVRQELREHSPFMKDGWTMQTLRAVFEYELESDFKGLVLRHCDQCHVEIWGLEVEVAWQRYLEHVRECRSQLATNSHEDLVGSVSEDSIQDQTSMDPIRNIDDDNQGLEVQSESDNSYSGDSSSESEPVECETDQASWERRFWQHRVVCVFCWHKFKDGLLNPRLETQDDSAEEDDDSEEDFSPYLFNT